VIADHDQLLRDIVETHHGHVFKLIGDACCAAFAAPRDAVAAALAGQLALLEADWPAGLRPSVRMGVHCGPVTAREGDYWGPALNRLSRILHAAHGGQILLSGPVVALVEGNLPPDCDLVSLGEHRLRDLERPIAISQLLHPCLPTGFPPVRSLQHIRHNLPLQVSAFIGREGELRELRARLGDHRLVTITGVGGCGKTRLAIQLAAELASAETDGAWLVELAALTDPALVTQTVAAELDVRPPPGGSFLDALLDHLRDRRLLLVMDNCEHLLDAASELAETILQHCSDVVIVATSREPLGVGGEVVYRLRSLGLPGAEDDVRALASAEAVRLFVERAAAAASGFDLRPHNAAAVAEICRRLDGLPLAIELAAARVRSMAPERIAGRLDERFKLLTGGSRTAMPRHRTLQGAVDWSYDLLHADEQRVLLALSVFYGGWTLEAAERVCGDGLERWELLDLFTSLVDKSLVIYDEEADRSRLLETVRQYAAERLAADAAAVRDRHLAWFGGLVAEGFAARRGPHEAEWAQRLEADQENLRAALDWCAAAPSRAADGLRLAGQLYWFWDHHGYWQEGRRQLEGALAAMPDAATPERALALQGAGLLTMHLGDLEAAERWDLAAMAAWERLGDRASYCRVQHNLGRVAQRREDLTTASRLIAECVAEQRRLGDLDGLPISLQSLGNLRSVEGDQAGAAELLEEALLLLHARDDGAGIAYCLSSLGNVAQRRGDLAAARRLHEQSLTIQRELGDRRGLMFALANLGAALRAEGDNHAARDRYEEGLRIAAQIGDRTATTVLLVNLGAIDTDEGCYAEAQARLDACLDLCRETGSRRMTAYCLRNLGSLARKQGHLETARDHYRASLELRVALDDRLGYPELWEAWAGLAEPALAAQLLGAADRLRAEVGLPRTPSQEHDLSTALAPLRQALGEAAWTASVRSGQALGDAEVLGLLHS
ncbi:MAG: tetratricopeptide repeat protein, partial [Armatimonadetes bacterium]|nr:tetratricopeptide repeat protein [Armatimonadota bacterium]